MDLLEDSEDVDRNSKYARVYLYGVGVTGIPVVAIYNMES